jgi:hypothetical protein
MSRSLRPKRDLVNNKLALLFKLSRCSMFAAVETVGPVHTQHQGHELLPYRKLRRSVHLTLHC